MPDAVDFIESGRGASTAPLSLALGLAWFLRRVALPDNSETTLPSASLVKDAMTMV